MGSRRLGCWIACGLALTALSCGESSVGTSSYGSDIDGVSGVGGDAELVGDENYREYLQKTEQWLEQQPAIAAPWVDMLTADRTRDVVIAPDSLTFPSTPESLAYTEGDIIGAANINEGKVFLRRVVSVQNTGFQVILTTENAAITDAVLKGSLTQRPTQDIPGTLSDTQRTTLQQLGLGDIFGDIPSGADLGKTSRLEDDAGTNFPGTIGLEISNPRFEAPDSDFEMSASISPNWGARIGEAFGFGTHIDAGRNSSGQFTRRVETTCAKVAHSLDFMRGDTPDQRACRSAYEAWANSPSYPAFPASTSNLRHRGSHLQCRDSIDYWPDGWIVLPYPEEVQWAKNNCRGVLENFHMEMQFNPQLDVNRAEISYTLEGQTGELLPQEFTNQRDEFLSRDKWFVRFVGWFPVAIKFEGKIIANFYKAQASGSVEFGVENMSVGVDTRLVLSYAGGDLESRSAWSTAGSSVTPHASGDISLTQGTLQGRVEREFFGLEGSILLYDLVGPYLRPIDLYGRVDAAVGFSNTDRQVCNFGLSGGSKAAFGIRGQIPFTDKNADWDLWEHDTCGEGDRLDPRFYAREEGQFCVKHCVQKIPLEIKLEWDEQVDLDLAVFLPGQNPESDIPLSYRDTSIGSATHNSTNGCLRNACAEGGPYHESAIWAQTPASGQYIVRVTNSQGDAAPNFRLTAKAQNQRGEYYYDTGVIERAAPGQRGQHIDIPLDMLRAQD